MTASVIFHLAMAVCFDANDHIPIGFINKLLLTKKDNLKITILE